MESGDRVRAVPPSWTSGGRWISTFRARPDRIIAAGRLLLAAVSLFAIWLDPTQPRRFQSIAYAALAAYTLYSLLVLLAAWNLRASHLRGALARHIVDLAAFAAIMYLTDGPTSPFFVFLGFAILSGALHWGGRGAVLTAIASVLILVALGIADIIDQTDPGLGVKTVVTRIAYLGAVGTVLAWLGVHQARVRGDIWRIAELAPSIPDGSGWPVRAALDYVGEIFDRRAFIIWNDDEEPWTYVTSWENGTSREERLPPDSHVPWVSPRARNAGIVAPDIRNGRTVLHTGSGRFEEWPQAEGPIVNPALVEEYAIGSVVSVPIHTGELDARLFLLDIPNADIDDLSTAEIIAGRLQVLFEQEVLLRRLRDSAAIEERVRIARDLHDGVLQALAGAALQLRSLDALVAAGPNEVKERLSAIEESLAQEQRELRSFIRRLGPHDNDAQSHPVLPEAALREQVDKLRRQWKIGIDCDIADSRPLNAGLVQDLGWLLAEATANAVRHGGADHVAARIAIEEGELLVDISDNGRGIERSPRAPQPVLNNGPRSLRSRTAARGGTLSFRSSGGGTIVSMRFPLEAAVR